MPAFAKLSLVTSVFYPADIAFVNGWSQRAPGIGGWRVQFDKNVGTEQILVTPPASDVPVFAISRNGVKAVVERLLPDGSAGDEIGIFESVRAAVLALCPLHADDLEAIHEALERDFPRTPRR